jgi:hypothetical protein
MADPVYKRIEDLDDATLPVAATDKTPISQSGTTKKVAESARYGAGWFAKLAAAVTAFVAPEATHAVNADTLGAGADTPAALHDAAQLTGAIHLDRIPAELTGKNAATADLADVAALAHSCDGDVASALAISTCGLTASRYAPGDSSQEYVGLYYIGGTQAWAGFQVPGGWDFGSARTMVYFRKS